MYFEIHVTMPAESKERTTEILGQVGFKFSALKGDPIMGDDLLFYGTAHTRTEDQAHLKLAQATKALEDSGITVLRRKIEHVIFDSRRLI